MREIEYVKTINQLEKIKNIQGTQKYQLRAACKDLADLKRLRLKRKAKDFSVDFEALNESGTRAFFRQKLARISGSLLRHLYSRFPKFFLKATNEEILKGKCHDKEIMQRKIIFIEKQQSKKECVKKYRPISLISAILKAADMTIVNRITP